MAIEVKAYRIEQLIRFNESGDLDLQRSLAVIRSAAATSRFHRDCPILVDIRATRRVMDFADLLEIAMEFSRHHEAFQNRVAVLIPDDPVRLSRTEVFVSAGREKGIDARHFVDYEAAIEWLAEVTLLASSA